MKKSEEWKTKYGMVSTLSKKEIEEFENYQGEEVSLSQILGQTKKKNKPIALFLTK